MRWRALGLGSNHAAGNQEPKTKNENAADPSGARTRDFAPGVRIDWTARTVELEARVVLREGPLELLACTPGTREHESILVVRGRPTHIYQAMGLVGLAPGSPVRFDEEAQRLIPPTGDAVELSVRYQKEGRETTVSASRWLMNIADKKPPGSIRWVFAGSIVLENDRPAGENGTERRSDGQKKLAAELDGTIVCVVDFPSALIAVDTLHTADNEALWLGANTAAIPPPGTPCTLLIRPDKKNEEGERDRAERADQDRNIEAKDGDSKGSED